MEKSGETLTNEFTLQYVQYIYWRHNDIFLLLYEDILSDSLKLLTESTIIKGIFLFNSQSVVAQQCDGFQQQI